MVGCQYTAVHRTKTENNSTSTGNILAFTRPSCSHQTNLTPSAGETACHCTHCNEQRCRGDDYHWRYKLRTLQPEHETGTNRQQAIRDDNPRYTGTDPYRSINNEYAKNPGTS